MLQPLAVRISLPSVLALLWDAYPRMALIHPCKLCKHARSFGLTLQTPFPSHDPHNILMIPHLGQRLHLPRYGPSVFPEQQRIGGSLGSDSKASSQEPSPRPISSGTDFATSPSCSGSVAPGKGGRSPHLREARLILAC